MDLLTKQTLNECSLMYLIIVLHIIEVGKMGNITTIPIIIDIYFNL